MEETEEDVPEEETTEPTEEEPAEETTEATEEALPKEPTEAPAEETEEPAVEEFPEEEEPILEEAPEEEFSLQSDEGTLASGICGESVNWVLTSDGTLTISGSGKMADYNTSSNTAPWYKNRTSIVNVVVKSGVTSLSSYAFYGCYKLASAVLEAGVETVGSYAFQDCKKLTGVTLSDGLKEIGYDAFSGCSGLTDMTIPEGVTKLGSSAFYNCSSLTSVNIPAGVTSIGYRAFSGCGSMTGVTIPVGVTSIGYSAFSGCRNLTSVTIPDSVTSIESSAFSGCSSLTSVNIPDRVTSIENSVFSGCGSLTSVNIPAGVTSICSSAFSGCSGLTSVAIPDGVTSIGSSAFSGCSGLTSVTVPEGVTSIGYSAFSDCSSLTSVTIPESITNIEESTFYKCSGLTSVTIPDSVTSIGYSAFSGCSSLTSVTIPEGVKSIGSCAFYDCSNLTSVEIPNSVTSIESSAFYNCSSLTSVTIPKGVTYIDHSTFYGCSNLISVEIPEGVTSFGNYVFYNCSSLTSVTIPKGVTKIGSYVFLGCSSLTSVTISDGVTSIGSYAFYKCSSLTSLTIPNGVTSIGVNTFYNCSKLTSVTIPTSVTSIGENAFQGCSSLTSVAIPGSVTSIGKQAFSGCSGLTSVTISEGVTSIGEYAFSGCSGLTSVTIPKGVTSIGDSTFFGCSGLTSVTIPAGVTSIGEWAFYGCSGLTSVEIPESVTSIGESAFSHCGGLTSVTIPEGVTSIERKTFYCCNNLTSVTIPASVTSIGDEAFCPCFNLKDVYYGSTKADWDKISFGEDNESLLYATLHYKGQSLPEIRPVDAAALDGGATLKLTLWSTEQNKKINAAWSLAEGDEAYATVTKDGTLTAKAVVKPVNITVIAQPTNGEPRVTKTIRINPKATALLLMLDEETLGATLNVDMYDRSVLPLAAIKNTGEEAKGIRWSTSKKDVAQVDANGVVTLLKPGTAVIQATDNGKLTGKVTLNVTYTDKSPRLEARTLTLNTALFGGVTVDFVEAYENGVEQLQWNDERFVFEYQENQLTVSAKNALKNGSYAVTLCVTCADEREYTYPLTIKVTNTLPKVTVKQTAKLNLFYRDSTAPLVISAPGQSIEEVELTDTADFALMSDGENWEITYITENAKPDTKGTLNVHLEGYREPVKVALTVGTVSTAPAVKLSATSSTLNTALNSDLTTQVVLLDKAGKPLELENPTVECDNADVKVNGNRLTITLNEAKSSTVTMYLQDSTWAKSVKLTHKITVSENLPTLKPAGNLTLNSLFAKGTAETGLVLSQSNLTLVNVEAVPAAKEGTPALAESEKLRITYAPESGHMVASIQDADNAPKAGTYSFNCTGTLEDGTTIPGGTLKVTVSATAPKVKLSATSVKLNKFLEGKEQGTVTVTAPNGYRVVDFEEMPEGMSYDKDTGILTVTLENASDNGGNYTLYPVVQNVETGEEVELPTKLSFKVQAYNSQKLSVSLSAKGKLDTQKDGEITYTVTKLANCLGAVEDMDLEGQDAALFRAEMDIVNGKPTVHLTLKDGETYATNKAYKVQFRFYACGKEILSPVQTVKVTQTALKVTAPKTITYYQAQKSPLRVVLTTNVPLDRVVLNDKTAKEFQAAVGEVTLNGNRVEFEITNPSALTAGKSYSVALDATPENNAENAKPVAVRLTVKVQK